MIRLTDLHGARAGSAAVRWDQRSVDVLSVVQTARTLRAEFIADHLHSGLETFGRWSGLSALFATLRRRFQHRRTLKALGQLDDRLLSDIGISRTEIAAAAALCCKEEAVAKPSAWSKLAARLRREVARRRTVRELSAMSDEMLADIGIDRADIPAVAAALAADQGIAAREETAIAQTEAPASAPVTAQVLAFIEVRRSAQQGAGDAANRNVNRPAA